MIDRKTAGSAIGNDRLLHADLLFDRWQRVRDGTLGRARFRSHNASWLRVEVRNLLQRGSASSCAKTAGTCQEILAVEASLWTFASTAGVEPTNNAAERAIRQAVCWRETSYGTDSEAGRRFVERMLTVVASCRQPGRNVLGFLIAAIQAAQIEARTPSLLPAGV
jgi:transposase